MRIQRQAVLGWSGVLISTTFMILASGLILYPRLTTENILTALRLSSLTTAIPFLLVFLLQPLTVVADGLGGWVRDNRRYLWLTLTISHLIHLYQIGFYYQLRQSCPLTIWLITSPLWIIMVGISVIDIVKPQLCDRLSQATVPKALNLLYGMSIWYVWLIFTIAFGLGAVAKHIPFYNVPAFVLFLSGAVLHAIVRWRRSATLKVLSGKVSRSKD